MGHKQIHVPARRRSPAIAPTRDNNHPRQLVLGVSLHHADDFLHLGALHPPLQVLEVLQTHRLVVVQQARPLVPAEVLDRAEALFVEAGGRRSSHAPDLCKLQHATDSGVTSQGVDALELPERDDLPDFLPGLLPDPLLASLGELPPEVLEVLRVPYRLRVLIEEADGLLHAEDLPVVLVSLRLPPSPVVVRRRVRERLVNGVELLQH
mmetsp:Transcript_2708/g.6263  ORF Transcript_2708/g.6263 Transcript_2708/m.6263 type:complete len:208 (-) Transcript_2708:68-691(-)